MSQPPDPQQPQWWQPPANPQAPAQPPQGWQPEQQASGPHAGQWQRNPDLGAVTGSHTGQWQGAQPGTTGSFSGPWRQQPPAQPAYGSQWQQAAPQPAPSTPSGGWPAQPGIPQEQLGGGFQPSQYGGLGAFSADVTEEIAVQEATRHQWGRRAGDRRRWRRGLASRCFPRGRPGAEVPSGRCGQGAERKLWRTGRQERPVSGERIGPITGSLSTAQPRSAVRKRK